MFQACAGLAFLVFFVFAVLLRVQSLRRKGINAVEFGNKDKKDFILIPFALFYFYLIAAHAFHWPTIQGRPLFFSGWIAWGGVVLMLLAAILFVAALISFKKSFRVGLKENTAQGLVTTGVFSFSRNPIFLAFALMLTGQFLVYPEWIRLLYIVLGFFVIHRQVLKEEQFLKQQYGAEFEAYCNSTGRYFLKI